MLLRLSCALLGKLVVWGRDRTEALERSRRALSEFEISGVATVLPFDRYIVTEPAFIGSGSGFGVHTRWIEEECTATFEPAAIVAAPGRAGLHRLPLEIDGRLVEVGIPDALLSRLGAAGARAGGRPVDRVSQSGDPRPPSRVGADPQGARPRSRRHPPTSAARPGRGPAAASVGPTLQAHPRRPAPHAGRSAAAAPAAHRQAQEVAP